MPACPLAYRELPQRFTPCRICRESTVVLHVIWLFDGILRRRSQWKASCNMRAPGPLQDLQTRGKERDMNVERLNTGEQVFNIVMKKIGFGCNVAIPVGKVLRTQTTGRFSSAKHVEEEMKVC